MSQSPLQQITIPKSDQKKIADVSSAVTNKPMLKSNEQPRRIQLHFTRTIEINRSLKSFLPPIPTLCWDFAGCLYSLFPIMQINAQPQEKGLLQEKFIA